MPKKNAGWVGGWLLVGVVVGSRVMFLFQKKSLVGSLKLMFFDVFTPDSGTCKFKSSSLFFKS